MKKKFQVHGKSVDYFYAEVEADSIEQANEMLRDMDASEFTPEPPMNGYWEDLPELTHEITAETSKQKKGGRSK